MEYYGCCADCVAVDLAGIEFLPVAIAHCYRFIDDCSDVVSQTVTPFCLAAILCGIRQWIAAHYDEFEVEEKRINRIKGEGARREEVKQVGAKGGT